MAYGKFIWIVCQKGKAKANNESDLHEIYATLQTIWLHFGKLNNVDYEVHMKTDMLLVGNMLNAVWVNRNICSSSDRGVNI